MKQWMKFYKQSTTIFCSVLFLGEYMTSIITISTFLPVSCEIHRIKTATAFPLGSAPWFLWNSISNYTTPNVNYKNMHYVYWAVILKH
jgi:hypothetical protein